MRNESVAGATAVCLRCDREVDADPMKTYYCYCRSEGGADPIVVHSLAVTAARRSPSRWHSPRLPGFAH